MMAYEISGFVLIFISFIISLKKNDSHQLKNKNTI